MSYHRFSMRILAIALIAAALAGCSMSGSVPTEDPALIQATLDQAKTEAVLTVVADMTQNAPTPTNTSEPTQAPTITLAPSATDIPTATQMPTATQVPPTATATYIVYTYTPVPSKTPDTITCSLSDVVPTFGEDFKPNAPFDGAWTIKNTGSTTWSANDLDVRYSSGTKMHEGTDIRDLPSDIAKDSTLRFILDMKAPSTTGRYTETWVISQSGANICVLSVTIDVVE